MLILGVTRWSGPKVQIMPSNSGTVSRVGNLTKKKLQVFPTQNWGTASERFWKQFDFCKAQHWTYSGQCVKNIQSFMDLVLLKRSEEDSVEDVEFTPLWFSNLHQVPLSRRDGPKRLIRPVTQWIRLWIFQFVNTPIPNWLSFCYHPYWKTFLWPHSNHNLTSNSPTNIAGSKIGPWMELMYFR